MDQACAFGATPVLMTYDGDVLGVEPAALSAPLHFVLVDLKAAKDTVVILAQLQARRGDLLGVVRGGGGMGGVAAVGDKASSAGPPPLRPAPACLRLARPEQPLLACRRPRRAPQAAFPHPATPEQQACVELLGPINADITGRAVQLMTAGDAEQVGWRLACACVVQTVWCSEPPATQACKRASPLLHPPLLRAAGRADVRGAAAV